MNANLWQSLIDGTAMPEQYLGLAILGAVGIGALLWAIDVHLDQTKRDARGRR